jgi:hypothetical protein
MDIYPEKWENYFCFILINSIFIPIKGINMIYFNKDLPKVEVHLINKDLSDIERYYNSILSILNKIELQSCNEDDICQIRSVYELLEVLNKNKVKNV